MALGVEICGKRGSMQYWFQNWVYCPKVSEFRHPTWTYYKVFEKCPKNAGKIIFPTFCCLIKKLDHNLGLHAKNQREISSNRVRRLLWPLGEGKCGKGGEMVNGKKEMDYRVQNSVSRPNVYDFRHPRWT